jgi:hypothetical protein
MKSNQTTGANSSNLRLLTSPNLERGRKGKNEKIGDQTFLFSLFFPLARFIRKAYAATTMGELNKNLLFTAPLHTATRRKGVGLTHTFEFE